MSVQLLPIPRVSVLLPVYNGARWLRAAIQSVLDQTFEDFELLVIDDGSKDDSWAVIQSFSDSRIHAIRQQNCGLAATLNVGIGQARADLIARQDQDDLMRPERLERQVAYLTEHPLCVAVGTSAAILDGDVTTDRRHQHPQEAVTLRMELLFDNPFVHSSVLLRRSALEEVGRYCEDRSRQPPEDYELWSRLGYRYEMANLGEVLTEYREVSGSMSRMGERPFLGNLLRISAENLHSVLANDYSFDQCAALAALYHACPSCMPVPLSIRKVQQMLEQAAMRIGGPRVEWSVELQISVKRKVKRLRREARLQYLPRQFVELMRRLRRGVLIQLTRNNP